MTLPHYRDLLIAAGLVAACARADGTPRDSAVASATRAAGAAEVSAGLVTTYPPAAVSPARWTFDSMPADGAPRGFLFARTGGGSQGRWVVRPAADAPSPPHVVVQADTDRTGDRFPVAVPEAWSARDVEVSVRCKPISGRVDQACGVVFRYLDENTYYLARANALEDNVRLYHVTNGRRREIASWSGRVIRGQWHTLSVRAVQDQIDVSWNGTRVISRRDDTLKEAGRVGLWVKADSYTEFDDLSATPVPPHRPE